MRGRDLRGAPGPATDGATSTQPGCEVGQWPAFNFGFAALHLDLGTDMGEPLECEHAITALGDTDQRTTTGVAHYDRASNTPSFHHADDNWALTVQGLVFWSGSDPQVPSTAWRSRCPAAPAWQASPVPIAPSPCRACWAVAASRPLQRSRRGSWLSAIQIGRVATLLGVKNEEVESMTAADLSLFTQRSQGSVAQVTRSINSEAE